MSGLRGLGGGPRALTDRNVRMSGAEAVNKLLRAFRKAEDNNPYQLPEMATPPTVAVSATTDAALAASIPLATANALTAAAAKVAWYGGVPAVIANTFVGMPVVSNLPANGNLASLANANVSADLSMYNHAAEIMTDADTVEFSIYCRTDRKVMFQVDGQYVSKAGHVGVTASNSYNFFKLTFTSKRPRRIRILMSNMSEAASSPTMLSAVRLSALSAFWKPDQSGVLRLGCYTDSYGMGGGTQTNWDTPNAAFTTLAGELLGMRDVRQLSQFGTGYIATGSGRSKLLAQIPRSISQQGPWDLILVAHGYNDAAQAPATVQAEALAALRLIREGAPNVPIVVVGPWGGRTGPSAAVVGVENAISSAVTALADPLCRFAPNSTAAQPFLFGTGYQGATNASGNSDVYIGTDGTHFTPIVGHEYGAYRVATAVRDAVEAMLK
ncbi:lysophospholipase L1-like esterase [Neorhizobium sp. JUb45]|nr:lysophospholipase L1-like esterase [Neorhizobium sp. JUb45]